MFATALLQAFAARDIVAVHQAPPIDNAVSLAPKVIVHAVGVADVAVVENLACHACAVSVVMTGELDPQIVAAFLRAGARDVLPDSSSFDTLLIVVLGDYADVSMVPLRSVKFFVECACRSNRSIALLSNNELSWIRSLAGGEKIAALAAHAGYSERSMFRHLPHGSTASFGASDRDQALLAARELGLCDVESSAGLVDTMTDR
jgi:DNA-binding NarL/FixJ family response regulator